MGLHDSIHGDSDGHPLLWPYVYLYLALALTSCAAVRPVVTSTATTPVPSPEISIEVAEARPNSLVLRIRADRRNPFERLEIWRNAPQAQPELLQEVPIDPSTWTLMIAEGVAFEDRGQPATPLVYTIVGVLGTERTTSTPLKVALKPTPPSTQATATILSDRIELTWVGPDDLGAVVFRRDLLAGEKKPRRIAVVNTSASRVFVDHDVVPQGAYAYRIALARSYSDYLQFGPPSDELYINVPSKENK